MTVKNANFNYCRTFSRLYVHKSALKALFMRTFSAGACLTVSFLMIGCGDSPQEKTPQESPVVSVPQPTPPKAEAPKRRPIDMSLFSGPEPKIPTRYTEDQMRYIYEVELGSNDVAQAENGDGDKYQDEVQHRFGLTDAENMGISKEALNKGWMHEDASQDFSEVYRTFRQKHLSRNQ